MTAFHDDTEADGPSRETEDPRQQKTEQTAECSGHDGNKPDTKTRPQDEGRPVPEYLRPQTQDLVACPTKIDVNILPTIPNNE